jgi:hypothetical protein
MLQATAEQKALHPDKMPQFACLQFCATPRLSTNNASSALRAGRICTSCLSSDRRQYVATCSLQRVVYMLKPQSYLSPAYAVACTDTPAFSCSAEQQAAATRQREFT